MPASEQKKPPGIFISYRRSDNPDAVGRIYDRLVTEFGRARVFKDVDSIPLGLDFRSHLNDIVGGCAAVLAIIGPRWLDVRNEAGGKRLEDPDDFVRIEIEAAMTRSVPVVPVLVGHAVMPGSSQLPASLAALVYRQSIEVRPDPDFHHDSTRLVTALRQILDPGAETSASAPPRPVKWMAALAVTALAAVALAIPAWKHLHPQPLPEIRTEIVTPPTDLPGAFALSPDGRQIVFVAKDGAVSRLWLRVLSSTSAQPLPGTEGAVSPFWSPDSRSVGFFADGAMKRLDIGGGQPQMLNPALSFAVSAAWSREGGILYSGMGQPFMRIAGTGGDAIPVETSISADTSSGVGAVFLPDGRRFLFARRDDVGGLYLGSLDGGKSIRLMNETPTLGGLGATAMTYLPSGWLLWVRTNTLMAQQLDIDKGAMLGEPMKLAEGVFSVSSASNGLIAYRGASAQRQLIWMDRSGQTLTAMGNAETSMASPRISPDGRRVAVSRITQNNSDIWLLDGARISRITFDPAAQAFPVWSPDGSRVAYLSGRTGTNGASSEIQQKLVSGAGAEEKLLATSDALSYPSSWSPDGRYLMYFNVKPGSRLVADIWVLPMEGERKPFPFLQTAALEVWGQFSPDGRWVAYQSDESGRTEVYVRPFLPPGNSQESSAMGAARWQVSAGGGVHPSWRPDGKELYFLDPAGVMMAAPIAVDGSAVAPGTPQRLFDSHIAGGGFDQAQGRQYDVAPDGRFLINTESSGSTLPITLLQNWNPAEK